MSEELNQPPPDPILRFRMRTMIAVTSVLAVLAAIAGPYYRSVDREAGRQGLLILWSFIVLESGVSFWMRMKESWRVPANCRFRYLVYARGKYRRGVWSTLWSVLLCLMLAGAIAMYSHTAALGPLRGVFTPSSLVEFYGSPLFQGMLVGSWTAALIFSFVRRPMFLCEEGVPLGKVTLAPWKYVRHGEWQTDRPETLKLHRLDGDIYLDVPNDVRGEVEAFVRGKTQFIDDLPPCPRFEEPGARRVGWIGEMIDVRADNLKQAPAVRFRLPALLAATTIVAVLAGMAGAYFRQQTPTAQHALMAYWGIVTTAALGGFAWRWRRAMNPDPTMGQVRWRVASAWRRRWAAPLLRTCIIVFFLLGLIHESRVMVERSAAMRPSSSEFWTFVVLRSTIFGVVLGMGLIINFIYPAFVCERGVWMLHRTIMWNRLKEWGWAPGRPGVLKLRESHGQAFLTVPTPFRAAVEAFIREKTELTIPAAQTQKIATDDAEEPEGEVI